MPAAFVAALAVCSTVASAAPGDLDRTWGKGGITKTPLEQAAQRVISVRDVTVTRAGVLVNGSAGHPDDRRPFLTRYTGRGRLDRRFGKAGVLRASAAGHVGVALPNGKVVLIGEPLRRLNRSGRLDRTFGVRGRARLRVGRCLYIANRVLRQPDGKLVLDVLSCRALRDLNDNTYALMRLHPDGRIDRAFGRSGVAAIRVGARGGLTWSSALRRQPDGRLILAGRAVSKRRQVFALVRFHSDGRLDRGFGNGGVVFTPASHEADVDSLFVQRDGKLLLAGCSVSGTEDPNDTLIMRYLEDGSLDRSWGAGGIRSYGDLGVSSAGRDCPRFAMTSQQNLFVLGSRLWRLKSDGSVDSSFGQRGSIAVGPGGEAMSVQRDGKLVVAGGAVVGPRRRGIDVRRYHGGGR
jgi:uncharacterized delta-60 repeat protein